LKKLSNIKAIKNKYFLLEKVEKKMFQIPKQRGVLILVLIFIANNLIEKCHGQVTSCYSGETLTNNIGYTFTANCSDSFNIVWNTTACLKRNSFSDVFNQSS
jgi:hypothetical protein